MKRIMAVYDIDPVYSEKFADFVNQKARVPFQAASFSTMKSLLDFSQRNEIELLLINDRADREQIEKVKAKQVVVLSDDGEIRTEEYPCTYKYQSADSVIREVMACYGAAPQTENIKVMSTSVRIIGVYSPVNRCMKTSLALTMGQILAQEEKVLYVNLEEYSGLEALMGETFVSDLSDLLYIYRQGSYEWPKLSAHVYRWGKLDYIPPVKYAEDLLEASGVEMAEFLMKIAGESDYSVMIVDVGQFGRQAADILEICDAVYMPIKEDCVSAAKVEEFETYLDNTGLEEVKEKIQKVKLPSAARLSRQDNYLEELLWGELGDYVRQLLKGIN